MDLQNEKCVMIIDENLPLGLIANTAAVLGATLGKLYPQLIGEDVQDQSKVIHKGIINTPVPILKGNAEKIRQLIDSLKQPGFEDVSLIDFCSIAQSSVSYPQYTEKMAATAEEALNYSGICLYGSKKKINKLTGSIALLR